jgi:hypothetical protein
MNLDGLNLSTKIQAKKIRNKQYKSKKKETSDSKVEKKPVSVPATPI